MDNFNVKIRNKLSDSLKSIVGKPNVDSYPEYDDEAYEGLYGKPKSKLPEDDTFDNLDLLINGEVMLPHNGEHMQASIIIIGVRTKMGLL